jgi:hypothetical protein
MNKNKDKVQTCIQKLYDFRSRIPANLSVEKIKQVWDVDVKEGRYGQNINVNKETIEEKIKMVEKDLKWLIFKPVVKFVGISGSVGAEFAKDEDDIDLFIVTSNDVAWIYRLYLYIRNVFYKKIRSKEKISKGENVKNKLCINFITEQRNLNFERNMFDLNELIYLKPVYNKKFLNLIFLSNQWLSDDYCISEKFLNRSEILVRDVKNLNKRNYLLMPINFFAFVGQVMFMLIMNHRPDLKRLWKNLKVGRIEFYPKDFKKEKLENVKSY